MNSADSNHCRPQRRPRCLPLAWLVLIVFDVCLVVMAVAQTRPVPDPGTTTEPLTVITEIPGPTDVPGDEVRFEALDVYVDSGQQPLAAWQFEIASVTPGVEIVGIEGGEHAAFENPPYYDARAIQQNRVILAAFSTAEDLPSGRSRVARIQVQLTGPGPREYRTELTISATKDGQQIPAQISIVRARA